MRKLRSNKKKKKLHRGFDILYDVILLQLKNLGINAKPRNLSLTKSGYVFYVLSGGKKLLFLLKKRKLEYVGPLPGVPWDQIVDIANTGGLCPESLLCLVQGIPFEPGSRLL